MVAPKVTDQEFIKAWQTLKSPDKVAKAIGLNIRNVYERRNRLEAKYGVPLDTEAPLRRGKITVPKEGYRSIAEVTGQVIVGSDGHFWPGERSVSFDALIKLIKRLEPKMIVMNGDNFDGARISRHAPGGWADLPDVAEELEAVKERLKEVEDAAPPSCPLLWPAGNHDSRFTARLAQHAPDYVKVQGFDIADHFPAWQMCWSVFVNEHTVIKHRFHSGQHGAFNNVLKSGKNIITGHTHKLHAIQYADYNGLRWGVEGGTLSDFGPHNDKFSYAEDAPHNWSQGFVVLSFNEQGVLLEPEFCRVIKGLPYFRGSVVE